MSKENAQKIQRIATRSRAENQSVATADTKYKNTKAGWGEIVRAHNLMVDGATVPENERNFLLECAPLVQSLRAKHKC